MIHFVVCLLLSSVTSERNHIYCDLSPMYVRNLQIRGILFTFVMFWTFDPAKNAIQGDAPEGSDTF